MANSYNSNPIILDTDMTTGWKASQTLSPRPVGVQIYKIQIISAGTTAAATVSVVDPIDSTVLFTAAVGASAGASGTILLNEDLHTTMRWRDFKATGMTTGVVKLYLWYRA